MGYYVLPEPDEVTYDRNGARGKMFPSFGLTAEAQFTLVESDTGMNTTLIQQDIDVSYYILEGDGQFVLDDTVEECHPGNLVVIPQGTKFTYHGRLKMLEICTPPWEEDQEETAA